MKTVSLVLLVLSGTLYAGKPPTLRKMELSFLCHETIDYSKPIAEPSSDDGNNKKKRKTSTFKNKQSTCKKRKSSQISEELVNATFENRKLNNYVVQCIRCHRFYQYGILRILKFNANNRYRCNKGKSHTTTLHSSPPQFTVKCIESNCNSIFSGSLKEVKDRIYNHTNKKHKVSYFSDELKSYVVEQLQTKLHAENATEEKNEKMDYNALFDESLDNQNSTNEWKLSSSEEENPYAFSGPIDPLFGDLVNETLMQ